MISVSRRAILSLINKLNPLLTMIVLSNIWQALHNSMPWMVWNLFLALIPLGLSIWLFRQASTRSSIWWVGVFVCIAFLPNAPYVLTDLIHLVHELRNEPSLLISTLVVIPKYLLFVFIGFEAYVLSLINAGHYLRQQGLRGSIVQAELALHGLSAIGVYLGRVERFNSWDLVTHPKHVIRSVAENLLDHRPLLFMIIGFVVITGLYWVLKQVTLAVLLRRRYLNELHRLSEGAGASSVDRR